MSASAKKLSWSIPLSLDNVPFQTIPGIWLNWKALPSKHNPKPRKVPCQPDKPDWNARVNNVSHCSDFDTARFNHEIDPEIIEGIGINLYALDPAKHPVTALDLDNCFDLKTNTLDPWAAKIINACNTYTEVSPSGRGVRLFYDGMFEGGSFTRGSLECYISGTKRYVTVTGVPLPGCEISDVKPLSDDLAAILAKHQGEAKERDNKSDKSPVEEWDKDRVTDMLDQLFDEDKEWRDSLAEYQPWLRLGMALHHQFEGNEEGLAVWHRISEQLGNYDSDELDSKYETFGGGAGQLTLRTYLQMAGRKGLLPNTAGVGEFQDLGSAEGTRHHFNTHDDLDPTNVPEDPDAANAWFGERFFVLVEQGIPVVAHWINDRFFNHTRLQRISFENFKKWYSNAKVNVIVKSGEVKQFPAAALWLNSKQDRHTFTNVTFDPHAEPTPDTLNLFTGFPYPALDTSADTAMLHEHICEILAEGNEEYYRYIMAWTARSFLEINKPGEVALVFKGLQGTGKSWFGHLLLRLAGNHGLHISNAKHLIGNFNAHLDGVSHLFADEALWAGDKAHLGILKSLLTERVLMIEAKYMTPVLRPNFLHVVMASNEDWVVPKAIDDRRFAVFEVSDKRRGDHKYFEELFRLSEDPATLQAFMKELLEWDVSRYNVRQIPETKAGIEQQLRTLDGIPRWLFTFLYEGHFREGDWRKRVTTQELYGVYESWARGQKFAQTEHIEQFGAYMKKLFGKPVQSRAHDRKRCVQLGTLEEARARFIDATGLKVDWGN